MRAEVTTVDGNVVAVEQNLTGTHLWVDGVEVHRGLGSEFLLPIDPAGHVWVYELSRRRGADLLIHQGRTYPLGPYTLRTAEVADAFSSIALFLPIAVVFPDLGAGAVAVGLFFTCLTLVRGRREPVEWLKIGNRVVQTFAIGVGLTLAGILTFHPSYWWR